MLSSPQSAKSPNHSSMKKAPQKQEETEKENLNVVRELKFNGKPPVLLGENRSPNFTNRQQSKQSLEIKKGVLLEISPNDPKINQNTEGILQQIVQDANINNS